MSGEAESEESEDAKTQEDDAPKRAREMCIRDRIKLVPVNAPYFQGANLLIAADCSAYAFGDFHNRFMRDRITLVGCPKLDQVDYSEKLTAILRENDIRSVAIVRMEVCLLYTSRCV